MGTTGAKRILIAPLDWGLGHTTRCIPLIRRLLAAGHLVSAAGNDAQLSLLQSLFPGIPLLPLGGYTVQYSRTRRGMFWTLMRQLPRLSSVIRSEQQWLQRLLQERKFDGIISDNRYGLFSDRVPSVIMTHQAQVLTGAGRPADMLVRQLHYRMLQKFGACWLVDVPEAPGLAGKLSHPARLPRNAEYLGPLSQLQPSRAAGSIGTHLMVLLSGPEPQRTILSRMLWQQVTGHSGSVVFVEGSDAAAAPGHIPGHIRYFKRLTSPELLLLLEAAGLVICRSGYSTLMDLSLLRRKAILIPTPGQTEQEYLGRHLQEEGVHLCFPQKGFSLSKALDAARIFPFRAPLPADSFRQFLPVLDRWAEGL